MLTMRTLSQDPEYPIKCLRPVQGQRQPAKDTEMGRGEDRGLRRR